MDADAAWERFKQLREQKDRGARPAKTFSLQANRMRLISIAATLVILAGIGMLIRMIGKQEPAPVQIAMVNIQTGMQTLSDTLPDGSIVT
jgi:gamma-glutamylcysteine synthetase